MASLLPKIRNKIKSISRLFYLGIMFVLNSVSTSIIAVLKFYLSILMLLCFNVTHAVLSTFPKFFSFIWLNLFAYYYLNAMRKAYGDVLENMRFRCSPKIVLLSSSRPRELAVLSIFKYQCHIFLLCICRLLLQSTKPIKSRFSATVQNLLRYQIFLSNV